MRQRTPGFAWTAVWAATLVLLPACASPFKPSEGDRLKAAMTPSMSATPVAAASAPAASPKVAPEQTKASTRWQLNERDRTLKAGLERWAQGSGWRLIWELGIDYPIEAPATFDGNFEQAVSAVMRNMAHADVPPKAILYRGNQVVRVVARGME